MNYVLKAFYYILSHCKIKMLEADSTFSVSEMIYIMDQSDS